jgi:hypothetical protein
MAMHAVGFATAVGMLSQLWDMAHRATLLQLGFVAWIGSPFLIAAAVTLRLRRSPGAAWALAAVSMVNWMIAVGSVYYEHIVMRPDSQGGFMFVALPLFELLGTAVGVALALVISMTRMRSVGSGG